MGQYTLGAGSGALSAFARARVLSLANSLSLSLCLSLGVPSLGAGLAMILLACHLRARISALESKPNEGRAAEHVNVLTVSFFGRDSWFATLEAAHSATTGTTDLTTLAHDSRRVVLMVLAHVFA